MKTPACRNLVRYAPALVAAIFVAGLFIAHRSIMNSATEEMLPALASPRLVVAKSARRLDVFDGDALVKSYPIALGRGAADGDKRVEGDGRTPEGEFYVFTKNPESRFYLSLGLSYPNAEAARRGLAENLISRAEHDAILEAVAAGRMPPQKTALGGEIYIHGGGRRDDWTEGCMALSNAEMKALFEAIPVGTRVTIEP